MTGAPSQRLRFGAIIDLDIVTVRIEEVSRPRSTSANRPQVKFHSPLPGLFYKQVEVLVGRRERRMIETVFLPIAFDRLGPFNQDHFHVVIAAAKPQRLGPIT